VSIELACSREDYARAERFVGWNASRRVFNDRVEPHWLPGGERFWYANRARDGRTFKLVDPERQSATPAFDRDRLAAALSVASGKHVAPNLLPFAEIEWEGADRIRFRLNAGKECWTCDLATYSCARAEERPGAREGEVASPDGRWAAFVRGGNIFVRGIPGDQEIQLTHDAEPDYEYGHPPDSTTTAVTDRLSGKPLPVLVVWSPDSRRLATHRLDQRKVRHLHLVQAAPPDDGSRPVLHSYRVPQPGDPDVALTETVVLDVSDRTAVFARHEPLPMMVFSPADAHLAWWGDDSRRLYLLARERADKAMRLLEVDALTGEVRTVVEERGATYVEANLVGRTRPNIRVLRGGREVVWFSERDGWAHLYLYDAETGACRRQITSGAYAVREIAHIDEEGRRVFFTAGGRDGSEPYYRHLYVAPLDGGEPELLTPEDADHAVTFSPSGRFFVDTFGRVDLPPATVVRSAAGSMVCRLEEADISDLTAEGWRFPERFRVKARDGVTDLYGVIYRPIAFDPSRRYPVIDDIYPGPQNIHAPKVFPTDDRSAFAFWHPQALAELGFIVVIIDGLGTALRSKAFHDYAYGRMEDAGGLPDHIGGLRQLAARYPELDLSRVGIFGHSGGGFASTHAILAFPDFYKVAVSSAGNHDQRGYSATWGEKYQGMPEGDNYLAQANHRLAGNLRGKLLLACGDMDDNVHPALTLKVVDALIKAGKDFDLLVLPNRNHAYNADPYFVRRRWDYFVRHLLGEEPPEAYAIQGPEAGA
jgi:dipeptidyl-peptidase-4